MTLVSGIALLTDGVAQAQAPKPREAQPTGPVRPQGLTSAPRTPPPAPQAPAEPQQRPIRQPPSQPSQQRGHGRLFQPQDLGMLEGPDREAWQRPRAAGANC